MLLLGRFGQAEPLLHELDAHLDLLLLRLHSLLAGHPPGTSGRPRLGFRRVYRCRIVKVARRLELPRKHAWRGGEATVTLGDK